jgi:hypothetical protein
MTTRRKFLGLGAAVAAAVGMPVAAEIKSPETVGPILLERVCDFNKSSYTAEGIREMEAARYPGWTWGCGTKFQWYFGSMCVCPNCGYHYLLTLEMLKSGKYHAGRSS